MTLVQSNINYKRPLLQSIQPDPKDRVIKITQIPGKMEIDFDEIFNNTETFQIIETTQQYQKQCMFALETHKILPEYCQNLVPFDCGISKWIPTQTTWYGLEAGLCYGIKKCPPCNEIRCKCDGHYVLTVLRYTMKTAPLYLTYNDDSSVFTITPYRYLEREAPHIILENTAFPVLNIIITETGYQWVRPSCISHSPLINTGLEILDLKVQSHSWYKMCVTYKSLTTEYCNTLMQSNKLDDLLYNIFTNANFYMTILQPTPAHIPYHYYNATTGPYADESACYNNQDPIYATNLYPCYEKYPREQNCMKIEKRFKDPVTATTLHLIMVAVDAIIHVLIQVITSLLTELYDESSKIIKFIISQIAPVLRSYGYVNIAMLTVSLIITTTTNPTINKIILTSLLVLISISLTPLTITQSITLITIISVIIEIIKIYLTSTIANSALPKNDQQLLDYIKTRKIK